MRPPYRWLTELGVGGFFLVAFALMALRPDFDPVRRYVSEYAVGWGGWWMRGGFLLLGVASLNVAAGFLRGDDGPEGGKRIGVLLGIWALAVLVAALAPVDLQEAPTTPVGAVHLGASLVGFLALFAAMIVAARRFRKDETWKPMAGTTRWVAVLSPLAFVLEASVFTTLGWVGVGQWILFGLAGGWLVLMGRGFRRASPAG